MLEFHENEFKILSNKNIKVYSDLDLILLLTLAKTTKTLRSIRLLADNRYGEDSVVLSRSIFENYINIAYILKEDSQRRARIFIGNGVLQYNNRLKELDLLKISPKEYTEQFSEEEIDKIRRERILYKEDLKKNKTQHFGTDWSFRGISGIAEEVGETNMYKMMYFLACQNSHLDAYGLEKYGEENNGASIFKDIPSLEQVEESLFWSIDYYLKFYGLVEKHFNINISNKLNKFEKKGQEIIGKYYPVK
jgi:hypothetical protein